MKMDKEMALDFSGAALRDIAEGAETHAKLIKRYHESEVSQSILDMAKPFDDLAAACRAMIALQERKD